MDSFRGMLYFIVLLSCHTENLVFCVKIPTPKKVLFGLLTPLSAAGRTRVWRLEYCITLKLHSTTLGIFSDDNILR